METAVALVNGRNKGSSADGSFVKPGTSRQNLSSFQSQTVQSEAGKNFTEMEGRGSSDFYRNTSEELFLKSLMESSIGMPVPTMEMLGFKNLSQNLRTDSEELFKTWLTNGEASHFYIFFVFQNHGYNSTSIVHCTRHTSQRKPAELAGSSGQQLGGVLQRKRSNDNLFPQDTALVDEQSSDLNQNSTRNVVERGLQASNLYLAKAWFHSSQPMTRSRSSELRRRYVSMQNSQTSLGVEAMHNVSGHGVNNLRQEFANPNGFGDVSMCEIPNHFNTFMSPSNSASSTFNTPHTDNIDKVSSVVSMLKGTLEHKKLNNETVEDSSLELYGAQEFLGDMNLNQGQGNRIHETLRTVQDVSSVQVNDHGVLEAVEGSLDMDLDGFVNPTNPMQMSMVSREPSQSESSAAAPAVSTGFDVCDEPTNLGQTMSIGESSKKQVGNGRSSENGTRAKDIKERIDDNLKDDRKPRRCLVRYGSVTSAGSVEKGDPTKKRRVERSRKMAEAKERNLTPPIPSDMQSILKRCENLEKEVRSLKLNLSFMNRKDSEQTKQIEELQKQNEELTEDKEHLLEEIERIIAEPGKM
ncbi:Protein CYCLOPS [Camellia lanceoleosa]|uniref:Protein CYCLOPS n=1 Tax=Camellia lanceoleosa TaxID=1840588 RepID=A0ACC0FYX8_9ERIC|nr:Protein CYCLOPS [Camellia lanceoleosa]